tara:strand:+ start:12109 stop:13224 length:1116 start_codon:yes stop_codon:yes gene_type:complete
LVYLVYAGITAFAQETYHEFDNENPIWSDNEGIHINAHGGGILRVKNRYYWFGEHKSSGQNGNKAFTGVHVYSSPDLYNWNDEGIALEMLTDVDSKLQKGAIVERPKVIYNNNTGKYVMWFHHELKDQGYSAALTGVAVADNVTGPYTYLDSFRIHPGVWPLNFTKEQREKAEKLFNQQEINLNDYAAEGVFLIRDFNEGQMSRDMTLFVDDDGTAYHITASENNRTLLISKLADDYLSLTNDYIRVFPGGKNEAPAVFKRKGKYYMITSGLTGWNPNPARSGVSDSMLGAWKSLGNPVQGTQEQEKTTFHSQSTFIIPVAGYDDAYIFMADRWKPKNAIEGEYIWLPIEFEDGIPILKWYAQWDLSFFEK